MDTSTNRRGRSWSALVMTARQLTPVSLRAQHGIHEVFDFTQFMRVSSTNGPSQSSCKSACSVPLNCAWMVRRHKRFCEGGPIITWSTNSTDDQLFVTTCRPGSSAENDPQIGRQATRSQPPRATGSNSPGQRARVQTGRIKRRDNLLAAIRRCRCIGDVATDATSKHWKSCLDMSGSIFVSDRAPG